MNKTPVNQYANVTDVLRYLEWHELNCTKTSRELTQQISRELNRVVTLKTLVVAALFNGFACIPQREHVIFCRVQQP